MKKSRINLPIKSVALGVAIIIASLLLMRYLAASLRSSDYFKVKDILVNKPEGKFDLSYLSGRNIFDIDLRKESRYISQLYPIYKKVGLFRILPDRLFVVFVERKGLAYVKLYKDFYVDSDRVFFDFPQGQEAADLPVIVGLERKIPGPKPGRQYNLKELITALNIIKETQSDNLIKKYRLERIDVSSAANVSCFIRPLQHDEGPAAGASKAIEVKIGQDDIAEKIKVLSGLLAQFGEGTGNINYIDLRFKEPVVKLNNDKNGTNTTRGAR